MHQWSLRYAPNIGLNSLDTPLFRALVGSDDPIEHIAFIADQGFAGIEDNFLKLRPVDQQARIGAELERRGLEMGCFVNNIATWDQPLWASPDAADRHAMRAELQESIEAAKRVNGKVMTTLVGSRPGVPVALQRSWLMENLKYLGEIAAQESVIIGLEACNSRDYPMLLLDDVMDAYAIVRAVDNPAVSLVFDLYHIQARGGDVIQKLHDCWDAIAAIQIADNPGRTEAGTGELNWVNIFNVLHDKGYQGLIELEHEVADKSINGELSVISHLKEIDSQIHIR